MYFNFEIFHMREKNIPVDSVEIKEPIHAFAWEPIGSKFAIIHGEPSNNSVSFYNVKSGQAPVLLSKFNILQHYKSNFKHNTIYFIFNFLKKKVLNDHISETELTLCSSLNYLKN